MTVSVLYRRILAVAVMIIAGLLAAGLMNAANAAGSVSVQQGKLVVTGGSEANAFFVTGNGGGNFSVTDGTASISAGTNCNKDGSTVRCFGVTSGIRVLAGGGNDAVRLRNTIQSSDIRGGDGNDVLIGSSTARDFIFGEGGNDSLSGSGNDFLNGGAGFDKCSAANDKVSCES
jgi:Ca2+-binding RTX toxin-like protein